jgi:hypothetical protein
MFLIPRRIWGNVFITIVSSKQKFQLFVKYLKDTLFSAKMFGRSSNVTFKDFFVGDELFHADGRTEQS